MTVIVQVEYFDRCTSRSCVPNNADTFRIPGKVLSPDISAWVEERYDCTGLWIAAFSTITAPLVAVAASESQVLAIIRSAGSLGQDMIDREADELPSFIRMVVFAVKIGPFSNDAPGGRGDRHYNLNYFVLCERDDLASSTQCLGHRSLYIPDLLGETMCRFFYFQGVLRAVPEASCSPEGRGLCPVARPRQLRQEGAGSICASLGLYADSLGRLFRNRSLDYTRRIGWIKEERNTQNFQTLDYAE
jgi:hypothetical protein